MSTLLKNVFVTCDDCGISTQGDMAYKPGVGIDSDKYVFHTFSNYVQCVDCHEKSKQKWLADKKQRGFSLKSWFFNLPDFHKFCPGWKGHVADW